MGEGTAVFIAMAIGVLLGGPIAWFVRNEIAKRRLLDIEARWQAVQRKTERQRDDLEAKLRSSVHRETKAEKDLLDQIKKNDDNLRLLHQKERQTRELESTLEEEKTTHRSLEAVIALMKGQLEQSAKVSARPSTAAPTRSLAATTCEDSDDLKQIRGIGPAYEKKLHELGVTTFRQIATWTPQQIPKIATRLGISSQRIERDDWIVGAKYRMMAKQGIEV